MMGAMITWALLFGFSPAFGFSHGEEESLLANHSPILEFFCGANVMTASVFSARKEVVFGFFFQVHSAPVP
jgi:hypothetical protein